MRLLVVLAILVAATPPPATATLQDDAGSGGDAPGLGSEGLVVRLGTFEGTMEHDPDGTSLDAYRLVDVPAGWAVEIEVEALGGGGLHHMAWDASRGLSSKRVEGMEREQLAAPSGVVRLWLWKDRWEGPATAYRVTTRLVPASDLRVEEVVVRETVPLLAQEIAVRVSNVGEADSSGSVGLWASHQERPFDRGARLIATDNVRLAAGESAVLTFDWFPWGRVGDVTIRATITDALDATPGNDEARGNGSILLANHGGVDVVEHEGEVALPGGAEAGLSSERAPHLAYAWVEHGDEGVCLSGRPDAWACSGFRP